MQAVWGWELNASCVSLWPELTHCIPPKVNVWWGRDGEPEIHRAALFSISGTARRQGSQGQCFIWTREWTFARYINQRRCTVSSKVKNESPSFFLPCEVTYWVCLQSIKLLFCDSALALIVEISVFSLLKKLRFKSALVQFQPAPFVACHTPPSNSFFLFHYLHKPSQYYLYSNNSQQKTLFSWSISRPHSYINW